MKKLIIFMLMVYIYAQNDIYLEYVNKLVNYNFVLKNVEGKNAPFEVKNEKKFPKYKRLERKIKIDLINIFNNNAYVKIIYYLGDQITKTEKKWIKKGYKIGDCKVINITLDTLKLKCKNNRKIIKTLNKKIIKIKEEK